MTYLCDDELVFICAGLDVDGAAVYEYDLLNERRDGDIEKQW